jgi:hypothetical protein
MHLKKVLPLPCGTHFKSGLLRFCTRRDVCAVSSGSSKALRIEHHQGTVCAVKCRRFCLRAGLDLAAFWAAQDAIKHKAVVAEVIESEVQQLLGGQTMEQYNQGFLEAHGEASLRHRAAAVEMMTLLDPKATQKAVQTLFKRGGLLGESLARVAHPFMAHTQFALRMWDGLESL